MLPPPPPSPFLQPPLGGVPPTPAPPSPHRNRTPWFVALGALVAAVLIALVVVAVGGDDERGAITIADGRTSDSTPGDDERVGAGVEVDGDDLPPFQDGREEGDDPAIGQTLPTISGVDLSGDPLTIEPGDPLLVVVMAHWCPHCQAEIPNIVQWAERGEVPRDVAIVGVSTAVDETRGNSPPAAWLEREQWPYATLADDDDLTALTALGATGFPTLIAVGEDGRVALRSSGESDLGTFRDLVDAALVGAPDDDSSPASTLPSGDTATCPAEDGSSPQRQEFDAPPPMCIDPARRYSANVTTSMGAFVIALDPANAPETVNNFVFLANYHFYDGIIFHRVIPGFVIQGGDPFGDGTGGPGYEFADELPAAGAYEQYSLAMANSGPDTNGSQFFVITGPDGVALSPDYSLFGKVVAGTEVIDAIQSVPTSEIDDRPTTPVVIRSIEIVKG